MMERNPKPNEIYRHFKGNLYRVLTLARHTETEELLVIYQALYGGYEVYARPLPMFVKEVDREKYPDAGQTYRFEKIPEGMGQAVPQAEAIPAGARQPSERGDASGVCQPSERGDASGVCQPSERGDASGVCQPSERRDASGARQPSERRDASGERQPSDHADAERKTMRLMEFLDADSYEAKLEALAAMREELDDEMINTMAMALDVEVEEGRLEERYQSLKNCLLMLDRFECSRLR